MSHSCSRPRPCLGEPIMPRNSEYQSPVSGHIPHRHPDCRTDGVLGHESASVGQRLSPPRPVARARAFFGAWYLTLPGLATAWLGFRAGGFFPGQVGLVAIDTRAGARRTHHTRFKTVRRLEFRSCTGIRSARRAGGLDARVGRLVGRAGARARRVRSDTSVRAGSRPDRLRRGPHRRFVHVAPMGRRGVRRDRPRRAFDPAAAGHVHDRRAVPPRARLVPADVLERDGDRVRRRRAAGTASDLERATSRASCRSSRRRCSRRSRSRCT